MVERADVNSVLNQMRQVREQMQSNVNKSTTPAKENLAAQVAKMQALTQQESIASNTVKGDASVPSFQNMFSNAINQVNHNQKVASDLRNRFEKGDPSVDLPEVMIAAQKSSVSFQAMNQVRNKLVEAYKDVMNMPV